MAKLITQVNTHKKHQLRQNNYPLNAIIND